MIYYKSIIMIRKLFCVKTNLKILNSRAGPVEVGVQGVQLHTQYLALLAVDT